jgi:hypothetical protein
LPGVDRKTTRADRYPPSKPTGWGCAVCRIRPAGKANIMAKKPKARPVDSIVDPSDLSEAIGLTRVLLCRDGKLTKLVAVAYDPREALNFAVEWNEKATESENARLVVVPPSTEKARNKSSVAVLCD